MPSRTQACPRRRIRTWPGHNLFAPKHDYGCPELTDIHLDTCDKGHVSFVIRGSMPNLITILDFLDGTRNQCLQQMHLTRTDNE